MPRADWFDAVARGNAFHGPEDRATVQPLTVSRFARLWRRVRAFLLWGRT